MPEMRFRVRWPDDTVMSCYSPSLVVKEYLTAGQQYVLADFVQRSRESLTIASERVKAKFGMYCTAASGQLLEIERKAEKFSDEPDSHVLVEGFDE